MSLTESLIHESICRVSGQSVGGSVGFVRFHRLQEVYFVEEQEEGGLAVRCDDSVRKIQRFECIHMQNTKEKVSFYLSAIAYLLFNLRVSGDLAGSMQATLWQILRTAPYVAGATWVLIAFLQYMSEGKKMPWDRRFRLFFTIGIIAGLFYAIYEYAGVGVRMQQ
jgi:hypothetical protein